MPLRGAYGLISAYRSRMTMLMATMTMTTATITFNHNHDVNDDDDDEDDDEYDTDDFCLSQTCGHFPSSSNSRPKKMKSTQV